MLERFKHFTSLLGSVEKSLQKIQKMEMAEIGLKGNQVQCLFHLYVDENLSFTELCRRCGQDKAALSRTIKLLEEGGYVFERVDKKYRNPVKLSKRGQEIGKYIADRINKMFFLGSENLDAKETEIFYSVFETVDKNLKHICQQYGEEK